MGTRLAVYVYAEDPVLQAGVVTQLRQRSEVWIIENGDVDAAHVALVVTDTVDEAAKTVSRALQRNGCPKVVFVVTSLDDAGILAGVEAGACGFVRRSDATPARLIEAIRAAEEGEGAMPADLLGRFLGQVSSLHANVLAPRGVNLAGLATREVEVLRMVADGHDTTEIAEQLCFSERTVKNVIHDVTARLQLRNRSHAVAYAMRHGLI